MLVAKGSSPWMASVEGWWWWWWSEGMVIGGGGGGGGHWPIDLQNLRIVWCLIPWWQQRNLQVHAVIGVGY